MILREEIEKALKADFHSLLVKEFTADWKVQRMVHDLELEVMDFKQLEALVQNKVNEARIKGIVEALEGVSQQHYGYKGELITDTYLSIKDRLRPIPEEPGFSLPVSDAINFYKSKLNPQEYE